MGSLHKNIQLMLELLKSPFLVLHFSYHTLMTFLMMLYVILLSMLMTTLDFECDQASDLWQQLELTLNLNLIYETLWTGPRIGLFILMLEKFNWFHLTGLITLMLLM